VNYLQLCQRMVSQYGLSGGTGPTTTHNQIGELGNVCSWISDACLMVDNMWEDWRYLWNAYAGTLSVASVTPSPVTQQGINVRRWVRKALKCRQASPLAPTWTPLAFMPFQQWQIQVDSDTQLPGAPVFWTELPDNTIAFDRPADQPYNLKGAFYQSPTALANDTDIPAMPPEYQRIIIIRALKFYADRENAPELVQSSVSEWPDLLEKLQSSQIDNYRDMRAATSNESHATDGGGMSARGFMGGRGY